MGRRRVKPFTLIEIFLALSILAFVGGLTLAYSKPMLDHYRFNHGLSLLKQEIDFTRRLSRIAHTDIEFYIKKKDKGLLCQRTTDEPLTLSYTFNVPLFIPYLTLKEENALLVFTSSGWIKEEKVLTLQYKKKQERIHLSNHI